MPNTMNWILDLCTKVISEKKGAKRKTIVNPTMIYTMFSVFAEDSPQQVRRNMVQWVNDNKQKFESQTLLAFTAKDSDLDTWLSNIENNSTPCCILGQQTLVELHAM